jgi:F-type H+-transporting ATPase subunit b
MALLYDTNVVVAIGFAIFVGVLIYYRVPGMILSRLDGRATRIRRELEEARALREEAQGLLAGFERKQKEVRGLADEIVAAARVEAAKGAEAAKEEIRRTVARRLQTATDQIAAAETAAIRQIRDRAVSVAVAAAAEVIGRGMRPGDADALIDAAIAEVGAKMH